MLNLHAETRRESAWDDGDEEEEENHQFDRSMLFFAASPSLFFRLTHMIFHPGSVNISNALLNNLLFILGPSEKGTEEGAEKK